MLTLLFAWWRSRHLTPDPRYIVRGDARDYTVDAGAPIYEVVAEAYDHTVDAGAPSYEVVAEARDYTVIA